MFTRLHYFLLNLFGGKAVILGGMTTKSAGVDRDPVMSAIAHPRIGTKKKQPTGCLLSGSRDSSLACGGSTAQDDGRSPWCKVIATIIMAALFATVSAVPADDLFTNQKWAEALSEYQKEADPSVATLQRVGQCALQSGQLPEAVLYWRRAQKNLSFGSYLLLSRLISGVQQQAGVARSQHPAYAMLSDGLCAVPLLWWQLLFLLLWALLLWRGRRLYGTNRWGWLSAILIIIIVVGVITAHCSAQRSRIHAVVLVSAPMHSGPSQRYTQLSTLTPASEVTVLSVRKSGAEPFYKVQQGYARGWVSGTHLGIV